MKPDAAGVIARREAGERLTCEDLAVLLESPSWTEIVAAGGRERARRLPGNKVGYGMFRVVNYTDICSVGCGFCSFHKAPGSPGIHVMPTELIAAKAHEAKSWGCDAVFLQGGVNPKLPLSYYTDALRAVQAEGLAVRGFSPVELVRLAGREHLSLPELLTILREAGLSSVPGAGAEILTSRMRAVLSPRKLSLDEWCATMGACHEAGLPGSCNIVFGSCETTADVVEHLAALRSQQDRTGGFQSFIAWVFQARTPNFPIRHVKSWEYLRLLAASRLFLDNIPHLEVSVMVMGRELAELALTAGADDISSVVFEENVLESRGLTSEAEARRFLTEAGFTPQRRSVDHIPC